MKILVISSLMTHHFNNRLAGGAEKVVEQMSQSLYEMGHSVDVFLYAGDVIKRDYNVIVCDDHLDAGLSPGARSNRVYEDLKQLCIKTNYDIIINHSARCWNTCFKLDKLLKEHSRNNNALCDVIGNERLTETKFIHIEHTSSESHMGMGRFDRFAKMVYANKLGHKVYMTCNHMINEWPLALRNKDEHVIKKRPNQITVEDIRNYSAHGAVMADIAKKYTVKESSGKGIYIGRASTEKNPLLAAEMYKELNIHADFFLASCCINTQTEEIMNKLSQYEKDGHITIHYDAPRDKLLDTLQNAMVLFVTGKDTFCLVGFEAAQMGVPTLFFVKNNLVSGLPMKYDYTFDNNRFIIDCHKKKNVEIAHEARNMIKLIPTDIKSRQNISDLVYENYNIEKYKNNLEKMINSLK